MRDLLFDGCEQGVLIIAAVLLIVCGLGRPIIDGLGFVLGALSSFGS